ncbi:MAG: chloride channel protein [Acidimicrobiales bacterium]
MTPLLKRFFETLTAARLGSGDDSAEAGSTTLSQRSVEALQQGRESSKVAGVLGANGVLRFVLYAGIGAVVGAIVALVEWVSIEVMLHRLEDVPLYVQALAPVVGLGVAAAILRFFWRTDSATSDMYVQAYHGNAEFESRRFLPKLAAAIATVGSGGALGLEGPSIYAGSSVGQAVGRRRLPFLGTRSPRVLMAAGAAAGVAAVFKAPATGVLFALEAPYRRDVARHALIPALVASSAAYITLISFLGSDRLLSFGATDFSFNDEVAGALVLGVFAGITARGVAKLFHHAKDLAHTTSFALRLPAAGAAIIVAAVSANALVDRAVTLGPGAELISEIVLDPTISVWTIIALFGLRALSTSAALAAGGVGGVFIPLVVQGLLLGRVVEVIFDAPSNGLYPVVGLAAVLGAGYRTPLAAVMFVAESTGRAEFVIPALLATAVSQSLMGEESVSVGQVGERVGQLERRLGLPTSEVMIPISGLVAPDDTLLEVIDELGADPQFLVVPVYDTEYHGLLVLSDMAPSLMTLGMESTVGDIVRDVPAVGAEVLARDAAEQLSTYNAAALAVLDTDGVPIGVVTATSLAGLDHLD